jgi:hypothetical protein
MILLWNLEKNTSNTLNTLNKTSFILNTLVK